MAEEGAAKQMAEMNLDPEEVKRLREEKKKQKEEEKKRKAAEKEARAAQRGQKKEKEVVIPTVVLGDFESSPFGMMMIDSKTKTDRKWLQIETIDDTLVGTKIWVRARISTSRVQGNKLCFLELRQAHAGRVNSVQGVVFGTEIAFFAGRLPKESVVDVEVEVKKAEEAIKACTVSGYELAIAKMYCISQSQPSLPFQLDDASRSDAELDANPELVRVGQDTRLDNRIIDLRTRTNAAILRLASGVCTLFREALLPLGFTEIHSPKMIATASEGGADVFKLGYFGGSAFLAQSPQLYKQMALAADMDRVFEIGPVFRAERSFTHRHLTEFTGLDMEMTFKEHYSEVLDVMDIMYHNIFNGLNERFRKEIDIVREQHPFEDLKYSYPSLRITFPEGMQLLRSHGPVILEREIAAETANPGPEPERLNRLKRHLESVKVHGDYDDINTEDEKLLGQCVREKYDTDFFVMDKYPADVRPFYTMPDPEDPRVTNSYDWFIRGEEICSGAQRIHDSKMLLDKAARMGVDLKPIQAYVEAFNFGAFPHGGGGVGMERVVMLFLGLSNIRKVSMFPRDPKRITP